MKKKFFFLLFIFCLNFNFLAAVTYNSEPKIFIQELVDDAIKTLGDKSLTQDEKNNEIMEIPKSRTNGWKGSWKKYYFEIMYIHGTYLLYPNFINSDAIYFTSGVLPVPPIVKLPTIIIGTSDLYLLTEFFKNFLLFLLVK